MKYWELSRARGLAVEWLLIGSLPFSGLHHESASFSQRLIDAGKGTEGFAGGQTAEAIKDHIVIRGFPSCSRGSCCAARGGATELKAAGEAVSKRGHRGFFRNFKFERGVWRREIVKVRSACQPPGVDDTAHVNQSELFGL